MKEDRRLGVTVLVTILGLVLLFGAGFAPLAQRAQRFEWVLTKKLTVQNDATFQGDTTQAGDFALTGDTTLTGDLEVVGATTIDGLTLENGETISNATDTAIVLGGFVGLDVAATQDLTATFTLTPTASYQPITNQTAGSITSSTSTAIADGAITGTLLIVCNQDAQDIVIDDGANTDIGGNQTLTGGADDCLWLLWNGADWNKLAAVADN